jgi:hypothetical protein
MAPPMQAIKLNAPQPTQPGGNPVNSRPHRTRQIAPGQQTRRCVIRISAIAFPRWALTATKGVTKLRFEAGIVCHETCDRAAPTGNFIIAWPEGCVNRWHSPDNVFAQEGVFDYNTGKVSPAPGSCLRHRQAPRLPTTRPPPGPRDPTHQTADAGFATRGHPEEEQESRASDEDASS